MGVRVISLTNDAENILTNLRENDREFNFSGFVREALIKFTGSSHLTESEIIKNKRDVEIEIESKKNELEYWDNKLIELKAIQESLKKEKEQAANDMFLMEDKKAYAKKVTINAFKEEVGRDMTDEEYEDYNDNIKTYRNIWAFADKVKSGK